MQDELDEEINRAAQRIAEILERGEPARSSNPRERHPAMRKFGIIGMATPEEIRQRGEKMRAEMQSRKTAEVLKPVKKTCKMCGSEFEEYKHGFSKPSICPTCIVKKAVMTNRANAVAKRLNDSSLLIDFAGDDRNILERLRTLAAKERRTPEMQVVCLLERALSREATS